MDVRKLTHNRKAVRSQLSQLDDGRVVTKTECFIHIPAKYVSKQLAILTGRDKFILNVFAMVMGDQYEVFCTPNMVKVCPTDTRRIVIDDTEYFELEFPAGSTVIENNEAMVIDTLAYYIYDLFVNSSDVPWFMSYDMRIKLFDETDTYCGTSFGANPFVMKMILAQTSRQVKDRTLMFRESIKTREDYNKTPAYISFNSVIFGPKTTSGKLAGSYFDLGVKAALSNPSTKSSDLEILQGI